MTVDIIQPDWPAPVNIKALSTTRVGGVSTGPYSSFNLATHVDDLPEHVLQNRQRLRERFHLPAEPVWLNQVHGVAVVDAAVATADAEVAADASYTDRRNRVCAVMTADCLPLLFCNRAGTRVAAAHAGWRGLQAGVIEATVAALGETPAQLLVWLGPAIGPDAFEVGDEVRAAFMTELPDSEVAFVASRPGHWLADIYQLARMRLHRLGIESVYGGQFCTYTDAQRFYSYRRDPTTGRMATLIWRE